MLCPVRAPHRHATVEQVDALGTPAHLGDCRAHTSAFGRLSRPYQRIWAIVAGRGAPLADEIEQSSRGVNEASTATDRIMRYTGHMEFLTLGQRLHTLRTLRGLTQEALAARVGVPQGRYSIWESERHPVPVDKLTDLARALDVDVRVLAEVHVSGPPRLPKFLSERDRHYTTLPYDIKGTIDQMLALPEGPHLLAAARRVLGPADIARIVQRFPRDSEFELYATFKLISMGAWLTRLTLAQAHCHVLVVDEYRSSRSALCVPRDALALDLDDVTILFFPQVWVVSVIQSDWYRVDFLCLVRRRDGTVRWAYIEIHGSQHELTPERDRRRAQGIPLRRHVYWARQLLRPDFGPTLVTNLTDLLDEPQIPFRLSA